MDIVEIPGHGPHLGAVSFIMSGNKYLQAVNIYNKKNAKTSGSKAKLIIINLRAHTVNAIGQLRI